MARKGRAFRSDEQAVMHDLVERARQAAADIIAHQLLREQAITDAAHQAGQPSQARQPTSTSGCRRRTHLQPLVLVMFDLDGFKSYNDTFGHLAGDAMLARLGAQTRRRRCPHMGPPTGWVVTSSACWSRPTPPSCTSCSRQRPARWKIAARTSRSRASYGAVLLPYEATTLDYALQLADERMYKHKKGRPSLAGDQTRDVLLRIMHAKQPSLQDHSSEVAELCLRVGRRLEMTAEELDELARAAELHDVGKVGIPDAILDKPEALNEAEWEFMHQHTVLGERILSAAPALRPVAVIVRATHERWDGRGYPDRRAGEAIPLGARIIAACDAYDAMTTDRCYRAGIGHEGACEEMRQQAGRQFDPQVVEALLDELDRDAAVQRPVAGGAGAPPETADEVAAHLRDVLARHIAGSGESGEAVSTSIPHRPAGSVSI